MKNKIILLFILLLIPTSCKAYDCTYEEQARLRKIASNVQTTFDYEEANGNVTFNVTLSNLNNDIYVYDTVMNKTYYYGGINEITLYGYKPGENIKYRIYTTKSDCASSYLNIKYVNLPYFNKYYNDPLCFGKKYNICNKWAKVTLTEEEFDKKIKELDSEVKEKEEVKEEQEKTTLDYIITFIYDYYLIIIVILVGIFLIVELTRRKKNGFDW